MGDYEAARINMIESQLRPNKVTDERVLAAFLGIRRELFVPPRFVGAAYIDEDIPLGGGRYLMEPMVAARLIQAAAVAPSETALVVGAGTGYEAALISRLGRSVVALESDPGLARAARDAMVEHVIASVAVVEGPLRDGHRPRAPYDVILVAGAVAEFPDEILQQLAEGGRLVGVVKPGEGMIGQAILVSRSGGVYARRIMFDAGTRPLPGFQPKSAFVF